MTDRTSGPTLIHIIEDRISKWLEAFLREQLNSKVLLDRRVALFKACQAGVEIAFEMMRQEREEGQHVVNEARLELYRRQKDIGRLERKLSSAAQALELIAAPVRPDGTFNRDRAACWAVAHDALESIRAKDSP